MNKPEGPLEAIGDAIGNVATFCLMAPIAAIAVGTTLAVQNVLSH